MTLRDRLAASLKGSAIPVSIAAAALGLLLIGTCMVRRAESKVNKVALSEATKPVTVIRAQTASFRPSRSYIGTVKSWERAKIGPQFVSAYVDSVLVRPGAVVHKGDVLATLDCRDTAAINQAVAMEARSLEEREKQLRAEAERYKQLLKQQFVSQNDAEAKIAKAESERAEVLAQKAKLAGSSLEVNDCVLKAPFDSEVATRSIDPGAFVRPGAEIVSVVDRSVVRVTADAPEVDFDVVAPGTKVVIHLLATDKDLDATVTRRAPAADEGTRTVHFELDVPDPDRVIPVGTTGEIRIDVGQPQPAIAVPLAAAAVKGDKAKLFVVERGLAHQQVLAVLGERAGILYLEPKLPPRAEVVTEGRALLADGDAVAAKEEEAPPQTSSASAPAPSQAP